MNNTYDTATPFQLALWPLSQDEQTVIREAVRILERKLSHGDSFTDPASVMRYCQLQIATDLDEAFCCMFLNSQHHLISFERLFKGTIDGASVYPRVVVRRALELNAAAIIFAHNHPSGVAEPSQADKHITQRLTDALKLIDVRVLDHIVVGSGDCVSFAERGLL